MACSNLAALDGATLLYCPLDGHHGLAEIYVISYL
jgi:hypothetical protein